MAATTKAPLAAAQNQCPNCEAYHKALHLSRLQNSALREANSPLADIVPSKISTLEKSFTARLEHMKATLATSDTELREALDARTAQLSQSQSSLKKLTLSLKKVRKLLSDTLSVKLRYEEIIKALIDNEANKGKLTIREVIALKEAPAPESVQIKKIVKRKTVSKSPSN